MISKAIKTSMSFVLTCCILSLLGCCAFALAEIRFDLEYGTLPGSTTLQTLGGLFFVTSNVCLLVLSLVYLLCMCVLVHIVAVVFETVRVSARIVVKGALFVAAVICFVGNLLQRFTGVCFVLLLSSYASGRCMKRIALSFVIVWVLPFEEPRCAAPVSSVDCALETVSWWLACLVFACLLLPALAFVISRLAACLSRFACEMGRFCAPAVAKGLVDVAVVLETTSQSTVQAFGSKRGKRVVLRLSFASVLLAMVTGVIGALLDGICARFIAICWVLVAAEMQRSSAAAKTAASGGVIVFEAIAVPRCDPNQLLYGNLSEIDVPHQEDHFEEASEAPSRIDDGEAEFESESDSDPDSDSDLENWESGYESEKTLVPTSCLTPIKEEGAHFPPDELISTIRVLPELSSTEKRTMYHTSEECREMARSYWAGEQVEEEEEDDDDINNTVDANVDGDIEEEVVANLFDEEEEEEKDANTNEATELVVAALLLPRQMTKKKAFGPSNRTRPFLSRTCKERVRYSK